ncbi:MAG: hypothetical protein ABJN66_03140 [Gilvibacter sp.]
MKDQFEIRLDFKPNTGSPERIFLAMAEYVSAFENLVHVVGKGIDPENEVNYRDSHCNKLVKSQLNQYIIKNHMDMDVI